MQNTNFIHGKAKEKFMFQKYCDDCGELFRPTGSSSKLCDNCREKRIKERDKKIREKKNDL